MRWLLIAMIVSVGALVLVSGGMAWHIWRQHAKLRSTGAGRDSESHAHEESDIETEEAP
jgi:ABC-type nickel/cobalt efflux system permease component RcnA